MNRQTILAVIHRQLRENLAETGQMRPLGEVVGIVAAEIREGLSTPPSSSVVPIEHVAAFVDGDLTEEESKAVCRAALVDNSVLAELVAAVRALQIPVEELAPVPDLLASQLLSMQGSLPAGDVATADPEPIEVATAVQAPRPVIATKPPKRPSARPRLKSQKRKPMNWLAIATVAAAIGGLIFVFNKEENPPEEKRPDFVKNEDVRKVIPDPDPIVPDDPGPAIVDLPEDPSANDTDITPKLPIPEPEPMIAKTPDDKPSPRPKPTIDRPKPKTNIAKATRMTGARWTDVAGILTRQKQVEVTSQARVQVYASVDVDSPALPSGDIDRMVLRTLPLSRAEATLQSGGRIVLAGDTSMQITQTNETSSARITVQWGDMALMELPKGTRIELIKGGQPTAILDWQSKASVVLQHSEAGLEMHVRDGKVNVNREAYENSSLAFDRKREIKKLPHPNRLPRWVDSPVEKIVVKQPFLAQIRKSNHVMATIGQQVKGLTQAPRLNDVDAKSMATLVRWQAALAGENIFRLANVDNAMTRMAAINYVVTLPPWDPRYNRTWTTIENSVRDRARVLRFKRWCVMAQQNTPAVQAQINSMLSDLSSSDVASRALSDYLLRRFQKNQARRLPVFDPTWTGANQLRGINLWRSHFGQQPIRNNRNQNPQPAAARGN